MDYLEIAKGITRQHVHNLDAASELRKLIIEVNRQAANEGLNVWLASTLLTQSILEKFEVLKRG
jgi:hypothetical protein